MGLCWLKKEVDFRQIEQIIFCPFYCRSDDTKMADWGGANPYKLVCIFTFKQLLRLAKTLLLYQIFSGSTPVTPARVLYIFRG